MKTFFCQASAVLLISTLATLLELVKANCWNRCIAHDMPEWICRNGVACSTCGEDECTVLCKTCPYSVYGGANCACQEPKWEGDCFRNQLPNKQDELTSRINWHTRLDTTLYADRRSYLFAREEFGPLRDDDNTMIAGVLYTLSDGNLKMSILFPPLYPSESRSAKLNVFDDDSGLLISQPSCSIANHTWHCLFRLENLPMGSSYRYTIRYKPNPNDSSLTYSLNGIIPRQVGYPKVVALGCFGKDDTTNKDKLVSAVLEEEPDLLVLQGDQTYFHTQLLYGFFETIYSLRNLTRNIPTIVQLDDHDYGMENLWGAEFGEEDSGYGFSQKPPCVINLKQQLAMGHNPEPAATGSNNVVKLKNGITVHYTNYIYGRLDFAILEARKFKSFDEDGTILGTEQEEWLRGWCNSNNGNRVKVVLAQTSFASIATHFYHMDGRLVSFAGRSAAKDSNGYPIPGRETALSILQNCGGPMPVVILSGDIHMGAAVAYDDYGIWECTSPAAINDVMWRVSRYEKNVEVKDPLGNSMRIMEAWNVPDGMMETYDSPRASEGASDEIKALRGDGFLVFSLDRMSATCSAHGYRNGNEVIWEITQPAASPDHTPSPIEARPSQTPSPATIENPLLPPTPESTTSTPSSPPTSRPSVTTEEGTSSTTAPSTSSSARSQLTFSPTTTGSSSTAACFSTVQCTMKTLFGASVLMAFVMHLF